MVIKLACIEDFVSWMKLVDKVKWNFPGLNSQQEYESYKQVVLKNINRGTAICAKKDDSVVGLLLFSKNKKILSCMAVDPDYRRQGIATKMVKYMFSFFANQDGIGVITFRENDEKGTAPRALYKRLGFCEDELCVEHNYPHQKFIIKQG